MDGRKLGWPREEHWQLWMFAVHQEMFYVEMLAETRYLLMFSKADRRQKARATTA